MRSGQQPFDLGQLLAEFAQRRLALGRFVLRAGVARLGRW
jgi:hypothetical protein